MEENITKDNYNPCIKLSIIVPVYNVEKYITKCASSLLSQTCSSDKFEVIFVNDGTKDNSIAILKEIIGDQTHTNFHIIEKQNGGLSSARNYGIKKSCGEYIWCVDSDDWIEENSINTVLHHISNHPDIILTSCVFMNYPNTETTEKTKIQVHKADGPTIMRNHPFFMAPTFIIKRKYWDTNGFQFHEGLLHEDTELMPRILYHAKSVEVIREPLYHYLQRTGSITHCKNSKRIYDMMQIIESHFLFIKNNVHKKDIDIVCSCFSDTILALFEASEEMNEHIKKEVNRFCKKKPIVPFILRHSSNVQFKLLGSLISFLPLKPISIYQMLRNIKKYFIRVKN